MTHQIPLPASACPPLSGSVLRGGTSASQEIKVDVYVRRRPDSPAQPDHDDLARMALHDRVHLSHRELAERYGACAEDLDAVERFVSGLGTGMEVTEVSQSQRRVSLRATAEASALAFGVELFDYDHPDGGHRAHPSPVHLPGELAPVVSTVLGLDTRPVAHHRRPIADAASPPAREAPSGYLPREVAAAYGFPRDLTGKGVSIGVVELGGGYRPEILDRYLRETAKAGTGGVATRIESIPVAGGANDPDSPESLEVYLDLEVIAAVATGASLAVYFAPLTVRGFVAAVHAAVHDEKRENAVVSISWGGSENVPAGASLPARADWPPFYRQMEQALQDAATLGVPVCASAGDHGSSNQRPPNRDDGGAHANYPASSPYVLSCGGTTLRLDRDRSSIASEVVWNEVRTGSGDAGTTGGATGGGLSRWFPRPAYQSGIDLPADVNGVTGDGRGFPDVAGNADRQTGYRIATDQGATVVGGTSAVAPLWAALIAMLTEKKGRRVGFLNPTLYRLRGEGFRDVTEGDNTTATVGGYSAAVGWDACTGWGSPDAPALLEKLAPDSGKGSSPQASRSKSSRGSTS